MKRPTSGGLTKRRLTRHDGGQYALKMRDNVVNSWAWLSSRKSSDNGTHSHTLVLRGDDLEFCQCDFFSKSNGDKYLVYVMLRFSWPGLMSTTLTTTTKKKKEGSDDEARPAPSTPHTFIKRYKVLMVPIFHLNSSFCWLAQKQRTPPTFSVYDNGLLWRNKKALMVGLKLSAVLGLIKFVRYVDWLFVHVSEIGTYRCSEYNFKYRRKNSKNVTRRRDIQQSCYFQKQLIRCLC